MTLATPMLLLVMMLTVGVPTWAVVIMSLFVAIAIAAVVANNMPRRVSAGHQV